MDFLRLLDGQRPNQLDLRGRMQNEIAAQALRHSGLNHDLATDIEDVLASHKNIAGGSVESIGLVNTYQDEAADEARRDIARSLEVVGQDTTLPDTTRTAADALLVHVLAQQAYLN